MDTESTTLTRSPYDILQVSPWAEEEAIKSKYFHLVKQYNPEYFPDEFIEIRTAYDVLKDANTRAATDVELFIPPPPFHSPDYPEFPDKQLSLFKLNQELKTLCGDAGLEGLQGEVRSEALHILRGIGLYHTLHEQLDESIQVWEHAVALDSDDTASQQNIYYAKWLVAYRAAMDGRMEDSEKRVFGDSRKRRRTRRSLSEFGFMPRKTRQKRRIG